MSKQDLLELYQYYNENEEIDFRRKYDELMIKNVRNQSTLILGLKFYIKRDNKKFIEIFNEMKEKNLLKKSVILYLIDNNKDNYFENEIMDLLGYLNGYELESNDIKIILNYDYTKNNFFWIIKNLVIEIDYLNSEDLDLIIKKCNYYNIDLNTIFNIPYSLPLNEINLIKNTWNKTINMDIKNNTILIDGGNVLFSHKGIYSFQGFIRLIDMVEQLKNYPLLIVLHQRHYQYKNKHFNKEQVKIIKKFYQDNKNIIYQTPNNEYDDLYFLQLSIEKQLFIISKDNFRDHIFQFINQKTLYHHLNRHLSYYVLDYSYHLDKLNLNIPEIKPIYNGIYNNEIILNDKNRFISFYYNLI